MTLDLTVQNPGAVVRPRPVSGGVPLPEGAAPPGAAFSLMASDGDAVPLQATVLAIWPDDSAKWVFLDYVAIPPAHGTSCHTLTWAKPPDASAAPAAAPVALDASGGALLRIAGRVGAAMVLTGEEDVSCTALPDAVTTESGGPVRKTVVVEGAFVNAEGQRRFRFRLRASAWADCPFVRLEPMILMDAENGVMHRIRALDLRLAALDGPGAVRIGGATAVTAGARLFQVDDAQYRVEGAEGSGQKAPGWAVLDDGGTGVGVALRDFWQQWPKSIEATGGGLTFGLLPRFEAGAFAHMLPDHKYQYAFDGDCYLLRTGQARMWDVWLDLAGDGEAAAAQANTPLVPFPDARAALDTNVWGAIEPAGTPGMEAYDAWADKLFGVYLESIEHQRHYGHMNWGDWYGERFVNWGNHEYDTPLQLLINYARTGDLRYYSLGDAAARHMSEVDVVQFMNDDLVAHLATTGQPAFYPARPGIVHQHTVGHVSGFYSKDEIRGFVRAADARYRDLETFYVCTDPFNLGHIWTLGMARAYFLTGNPFLKETVMKVGDNLAQLIEDDEHNMTGHSHGGRMVGWTLIALQGAYEVSQDQRYLDAMRTLSYSALDAQDPNCGGWLYHPMENGHCNCTIKHTGMATFITGVMIDGIAAYYWMSRDERVPEALNRAATFMNRDAWVEQGRSWRYTSCPATRVTGQAGVILMALVNAIRMKRDAELERILHIAWADKFERYSRESLSEVTHGQGKSYTSLILGCAETVSLLAQLAREERPPVPQTRA